MFLPITLDAGQISIPNTIGMLTGAIAETLNGFGIISPDIG